MDSRRTRYAASFVAASLAYIFVVLAFTGQFNIVAWAVFAAAFLVYLVVFERLFAWAASD